MINNYQRKRLENGEEELWVLWLPAEPVPPAAGCRCSWGAHLNLSWLWVSGEKRVHRGTGEPRALWASSCLFHCFVLYWSRVTVLAALTSLLANVDTKGMRWILLNPRGSIFLAALAQLSTLTQSQLVLQTFVIHSKVPLGLHVPGLSSRVLYQVTGQQQRVATSAAGLCPMRLRSISPTIPHQCFVQHWPMPNLPQREAVCDMGSSCPSRWLPKRGGVAAFYRISRP